MDSFSTETLLGLFVILMFFSAFFSSSETGMLALNRYKLRHLANNRHRGAMRAENLLKRPDKLISVILIGNNLVNNFVTIVAVVITARVFGDAAVTILPLILTPIFLVFAEVTPKTIAAYFPEKIAFPASMVLRPLLWLLHPAVASVNVIANIVAKILGADTQKASLAEHLRPEELRTVVDEAGELIPDHHQGMLLNVLDLEKATVEDIMVPRNEVMGIDIDSDIEDILTLMRSAEYTHLPVYSGDINKVIGELHMRDAAKLIGDKDAALTHDRIKGFLTDPYFVPESTPLTTQLINFQKTKRRLAMAVDEYGEVQGIATLGDLLEEIVGDFVTDAAEEKEEEIIPYKGDWFQIDATTSVRDINKQLGWNMPTDGPKTLNGIIVEYLEHIPDALVSFEIGHYRFEIEEFGETRIEKARVCEKPM